MSRAPRVTVGVPFFDEERWIGDAIRSVLRQTFTDLEVLLVDDGSSDRSLAIARSFDDPRVRVVSDGRRRRLPARLNEIVAMARAPYVARMDADDVMHPDRLAREIAILESDASCDAVGTWVALVAEDDAVLGVVEGASLPATPRVALERGVLAHATLLARRDWLLAHPYDETLTRAEDRDLWCRTVATSTLRIVPECLYVVRVSPSDARFIGDYADAQRQNRTLYRRYGPALVGWPRTARMIAGSHLKSALTRAMLRVGAVDVLLRRRGRAPSPADVARVREALAAARQTA